MGSELKLLKTPFFKHDGPEVEIAAAGIVQNRSACCPTLVTSTRSCCTLIVRPVWSQGRSPKALLHPRLGVSRDLTSLLPWPIVRVRSVAIGTLRAIIWSLRPWTSLGPSAER